MQRVLIIGAGPAGLTAGHLLTQHGHSVSIFEDDPAYVGGISRTIKYKDYYFDLGGHRFYTKSQEVSDFWHSILPDDLLTKERRSRIYYKGHFFSYPLRVFEILFTVEWQESLSFISSYFLSRFGHRYKIRNFEDWVVRHFGKSLFNAFFKSYTEKVWGLKCSEISRDWADQRINSLSLWKVIINSIFFKKGHKSLIRTFLYPRLGPGMLWEKCADMVIKNGGEILLGHKIIHVEQDEHGIWMLRDQAGNTYTGDVLISSAPIRDFVNCFGAKLSSRVITSANSLTYRSMVVVALIIESQGTFDDNWIYIHDTGVLVGRIQNYRAWSEQMVPDQNTLCLGMEYFCNEEDELWCLSDQALKELGERELNRLNLFSSTVNIKDYNVVRVPKAYPIYDHDYADHLTILRNEFQRKFSNLHLVGRNGMHRYNNQDHSCMTAMLAVKNIISKKNRYDPWKVNQDAIYLET